MAYINSIRPHHENTQQTRKRRLAGAGGEREREGHGHAPPATEENANLEATTNKKKKSKRALYYNTVSTGGTPKSTLERKNSPVKLRTRATVPGGHHRVMEPEPQALHGRAEGVQ